MDIVLRGSFFVLPLIFFIKKNIKWNLPVF